MKISILTDASPVVVLNWLRTGKSELNHSGVGVDYLMAGGNYAIRDGGPFQARIFNCAMKYEAGFMTNKGSSIKKPEDIKPGTRLLEITLDPAFARYNDALLAWAGLDRSQVTIVKAATLDALADFIIDNKADITYSSPVLPQVMRVESSPGGIAWMRLTPASNPAGAKKFFEKTNGVFGYGTMSGAGSPASKGVPGLFSVGAYFTAASVNKDLTYNLIKWLDINYDRYKASNPSNSNMTLNNLMILAETGFAPIHEGVVQYLKEKGLWTDKHQARWQYNVGRLTAWESAYKDAIKAADAKGINVDPQNTQWQELWKQMQTDRKLEKINYFSGL
jgi:hypothetical protein